MNLYQISSEIESRIAQLDERLANGELPPPDDAEIQALLGLIEGDLADKVGAYRYVVLNLQAQEQAYKDEIAKLNAGKKSVSNNIDRLKNAVLSAMTATGQKSFKFDTGFVRVQKNGQPSVMLDIDPEHLPKEFQKVTIEADTTAIKEFIKNGGEIKGVRLVTGEHLRVG